MKRLFLFLLSFACLTTAIAQSKDIKINRNPTKSKDKTYIPDANEKTPSPSDNPGKNMDTGNAEADVEALVYRLFSAMNQSNSQMIKSLFAPGGRLIGTDANGTMTPMTVEDFATRISKSPVGSLEERVTSMEVRVDDALATAWVGYDFYVNGNFNHCGYDAFQLHRGTSGWRITQIADTRKEKCSPGGETGVINNVMDGWHLAASNANSRTYFDLISADGIFLGTDPAENWNKDQFYKFAKPFFDKGSAWKFNATERNVFFSEDGSISWFNELLDTWMGRCRGSGVLTKDKSGQWKLRQYNLAMLVPNDLVQDYLKLVESKK